MGMSSTSRQLLFYALIYSLFSFIISPESAFVTYWASLIYMLTIYNLIVIPFRMSFGFINDDVGFWFFFDLFTDLFFIIDIYLSFHIVSARCIRFQVLSDSLL